MAVRKIYAFFLLMSLVVCSVASAADAIMPLTQVHKGMKGYGVTVFEGDRLERFDVEILGVLNNIGPQQDLILAKVDHPVIRNAGVIAGMSGSPVYIDGKVIGALAYAWDFAKDPIAGITPIEQMLQIGTKAVRSAAPNGARVTATQMLSTIAAHDPASLQKGLESFFPRPSAMSTGNANPIATPVAFSGFDSGTIDRFGALLQSHGLMPVPSGATAAGANKDVAATNPSFKGGDAIAGVLVGGDFSVAATGTVTYVDGKTVYGFGHPFLDMGEVNIPMAKAEIVTVLPNLARSFKFANTGAIIGALRQDRASGIMGYVGENADTIPVEIRVDDAGSPQVSHFQIMRHPQMFPVLLAMVTDSIVARAERAAGERTVILDSEIDVHGFAPVKLRDAWAGADARQSIPAYLGLVAGYLLSNEFSDASIDSVKITLRHDDNVRTARLLEASVDTPADGEFNPGDTVHLRTILKPFRGEAFTETFDLKIPETMRSGKAYVFIGSGSMMNRLDFTLVPPDPRNLAQVVDVMERLRSSSDLSLGLYSAAEGTVTAGVYLPDLPPSVHAIVVSDSSNSAQAAVKYQAPDHQNRPLDFVIEGSMKIDLDVKPKL